VTGRTLEGEVSAPRPPLAAPMVTRVLRTDHVRMPRSTITIRPASDEESAVRRLALLDSQRPLTGPVLVAQVDGEPVAAMSAASGRVVADPFRRTSAIVDALRGIAVAFAA